MVVSGLNQHKTDQRFLALAHQEKRLQGARIPEYSIKRSRVNRFKGHRCANLYCRALRQMR